MVTESWYHREVKLLTHESTTTTTITKLQCGYSVLFIQKHTFRVFLAIFLAFWTNFWRLFYSKNNKIPKHSPPSDFADQLTLFKV